MPSIHSSVITRLAVRRQSTSGTRKPSSGVMLSAISEMAAASSRRSISRSVVCFRLSTTATGFRRRDGAMEALDHAGGEIVAVEVAAEALLDVGPQDLHGHGLAATPSSMTYGLVHLRDGGGRDRRAEFDEMIFELAAERLLDRARAPRAMRERRQPVLQVAQVGGEFRARSDRRGSPGTGRA